MVRKIRIVVQTIKQVTVVTFEDSRLVDSHEIEQLGEELYPLVDEQDRRKLVLDMTKVAQLSSAALSVLLVLRQKVETARGSLILCGVRKEIKKSFKVTSLHKLFTFVDTEQDALRKLGVIIG
jgi:anti-anti-sigma factor